MIEFWTHRVGDRRISSQFWLGSILAASLKDAKTAARKRWPHWAGEMYLQQAGTKFHVTKEFTV